MSSSHEHDLTSELVALVNLLGVRVFGEMEFWFSSIKGKYMLFSYMSSSNHVIQVVSLIGLLLMGIIIDLGVFVQNQFNLILNLTKVAILNTIVLDSDTGRLPMVLWATTSSAWCIRNIYRFSWDSGPC